MSIKSDIEALEKALEAGPTPGPWAFEVDRCGDSWVSAGVGEVLMCDTRYYPWTPDPVTMEYMAICSPDRIKRLLDSHAKVIDLLSKARRELFTSNPSLTAVEEIDTFLKEQQ